MGPFFRYIAQTGISLGVAAGVCLMTAMPSVSDQTIFHNPWAQFRLRSEGTTWVTALPPSAVAARHHRPTPRSARRKVTALKGSPRSTAAKSGGPPSLQSVTAADTMPVNPFAAPRLVIYLSQRQVSLYQPDGQRKNYPIAIGRPGWETPIGKFKVMDMRQDPTWINPFTGEAIPPDDPQNPLGGYWIGFWTDGHNWIGFHGTPNGDSVGTAASHGCIRMYRQDIAELFAQVTPGMPVTVQP